MLAATTIMLTLSTTGCEWFTDFKEQPKVKPWRSLGADSAHAVVRGNPQFSVPITGTLVAGYQVSYNPLPGTIDSMSSLQNPVSPTDSSIALGRRYYQINCSVCHGESGKGDGMATHYGMPGMNLMIDITKGRTDGYIWGMIRNGRGLMPPYNRIEEKERWDVVNYIRAMQGKMAVAPVMGPLGYPGQTGTTVPGYTETAPTRPVPYLHPSPLPNEPTAAPSPQPAARSQQPATSSPPPPARSPQGGTP